jgi:16S rRNA (cytidine1402-2'-O)-methyltransferase
MSGMSARRFVFEGFLPVDKKQRKHVLESLTDEERTIILYESPHHLKDTLKELEAALGEERKITVCRELTKKFEEAVPTTIADAEAFYDENDPRGEYVLVIEGADPAVKEQEKRESFENMSIEEHVAKYEAQGESHKEAMRKAAADRGISRRDVYNALIVKK